MSKVHWAKTLTGVPERSLDESIHVVREAVRAAGCELDLKRINDIENARLTALNTALDEASAFIEQRFTLTPAQRRARRDVLARIKALRGKP